MLDLLGLHASAQILVGRTVITPELAGRVRLPCLFPRCLVTFKSQHGCTYHIRAVHTNSNLREHHFQEPHNLEGPDLAQMDSEGGDVL